MKTKLMETPLNLSQVKEALTTVKDKEGELNYRAGKTYDYLEQFAKLSPKDAHKLAEDLTKLAIPRIKDQHIMKLIDVLPTSAKDVKTVLQGYAVTVTNDNLQKIADTIAAAVK